MQVCASVSVTLVTDWRLRRSWCVHLREDLGPSVVERISLFDDLYSAPIEIAYFTSRRAANEDRVVGGTKVETRLTELDLRAMRQ